MHIPYVKERASSDTLKVFPDVQGVYRPKIKIAVEYNGIKQKVFALIDSGADSCLFPRDIGEVLNIDVRKGLPIMYTGIGGQQVPFYFHEVTVFFDQYSFKTMAGFAHAGIGTGGILGQRGFFENFAVKFDYKHLVVEVKEPGLV